MYITRKIEEKNRELRNEQEREINGERELSILKWNRDKVIINNIFAFQMALDIIRNDENPEP